MSQIRYKRILLKLSGEALAGGQHRGLDFDTIGKVCDAVSYTHLDVYKRQAFPSGIGLIG